MTSVVIAAHNEAAVLGRCLDALLRDCPPGELDITVVANGCTDNTAEVARQRPGVRVIELAQASKSAALNAGDARAVGFPRLYLDADIPLPGAAVRELAAALTEPGVLAVVPRRVLQLHGRPALVRAYFAINRRLPAYHRGLFGRGAVALSAAGRARFDTFPDVVADDLFLDSRFSEAEKREVTTVAAEVAAPRRTLDLVRRLARVRAGSRALRQRRSTVDDGEGSVRASARSSWLRDVVLPRPWLAPAAACYVALIAAAELTARRTGGAWGHDLSSREA